MTDGGGRRGRTRAAPLDLEPRGGGRTVARGATLGANRAEGWEARGRAVADEPEPPDARGRTAGAPPDPLDGVEPRTCTRVPGVLAVADPALGRAVSTRPWASERVVGRRPVVGRERGPRTGAAVEDARGRLRSSCGRLRPSDVGRPRTAGVREAAPERARDSGSVPLGRAAPRFLAPFEPPLSRKRVLGRVAADGRVAVGVRSRPEVRGGASRAPGCGVARPASEPVRRGELRPGLVTTPPFEERRLAVRCGPSRRCTNGLVS